MSVGALRRSLRDTETQLPAADHYPHTNEMQTHRDPEQALICVCGQCSQLLACIQQNWQDHVTDLDKQIMQGCPAWEPVGDTLPDEPDVLQALLENPSYGTIGTLVESLKTARRAIKQINNDNVGVFVGPEIDKAMKRACIHGALTVSTTFAALKITTATSQIANKRARVQELHNLRAALKAKGTPTLCKSIEAKFEELQKDDYVVPNGGGGGGEPM